MNTFPKTHRLLSKEDFLKLKTGCTKIESNLFIIYFIKTNVDSMHSRIGLAVSKKFGKSTIRNRAKRLIRETFRRVQGHENLTIDFLVIPKYSAKKFLYAETLVLVEDLRTLLQKLSTINT